MADPNRDEPTRWEQVEPLLDAVLEQPADLRAAWLDGAVSDPELRAEVDGLLEAHAKAEREGFLGSAALSSPGVPKGRVIGAYRVVEELGRGGMGVVYLAERADAQFEQRVALKIVKRGFDSDQVVRRFLQERQILARLQHPNIARLYDGGVTETGQPFFAMEHIDGVPLTTYCDNRRLDIDARLRLFEQVGEAVQYAHRNLIVHRDLKPSNILVTPDGAVKLLDFGIARVLDDQEADAGLTRTGMQVLTPAYAAPEQAAGEPVTTAADVYSLGVVLYELLTGRVPHTGKPLDRTRPVQRPSAAVTSPTDGPRADGSSRDLTPEAVGEARSTPPARLRRRLSGDLDAICLKALRPEPEQRYDGAAAFVEDVRRHRTGLPVGARADAAGYRMRAFIRRHRGLVGATAAVIVALAAGLTAALWQARRATAAAARAEAEAATSARVKEYLVQVFGASDPRGEPGGAELTARDLLAKGADGIAALDDEPAVQAELMDALGGVYGNLGLYEEARSLLEQALATRRALRGPEHPEVATSMISLAGLMLDMGAYDDAEPLYRQALEMRRRLLGADHTDVAATLNDLGTLLIYEGTPDEAEPLLRESLAIQRRSFGAEPQFSVAVTLANLAGVLRRRGALDEAEPLYRQALDMQRELLGPEHANVATSLASLALLERDRGATDEAEALLRESLAIRQKVFGEAHDVTAGARFQLARLLVETGHADEAEPLFRQALQASEDVNGAQHWKTALARVGLGSTLIALQRYEEASAQLEEAYAFFRREGAGGSPDAPAEALEALVRLHEAWGHPAEARRYQAALDRLRAGG